MTARTILTEFSLPNRRRKNQRSPVRWIISLALPYWVLVLTTIIGAFGNAALAAVIPIVIGMAFNAIQQTPPNTGFLPVAAFWIVLSQIIRGGLQFVRNFSAELLGQRLERDIREELYVSLLGKSMAFHSLQPVGDTMARATNDVREINYMFSPGLNLVVGSANFLIVPLIVAPRYYPTLIIVPAVYVVLYFLSLWQYLRELDPITEEVRTSFGEMNAHLAEAIDGIETVKGMAQEGSEALRFAKNARRYRDAFVRQGDVEARFLPLLLLGVAEAAALAQAMLLYQRGLLNLGDVVGYFGLILLFGFPTFVSLFAYSQVSLGIASARRILELINRESHLDQNEQGYNRPMTGEIEFRHVSFAYPDGETVLDDISFKVEPGKTVALVGQTGTGKTTLVKLVNRTYDVTSGQVLVDGVDVRDWNLEALRRGISIIEQDVFLFSRSLAENVAFGAPDADPEAISKAVDFAQATEFIGSFQGGLDTVVGERGVTLSGGQRQRIALARAFLTDPRILILDDSTSAIDSATEDKIQRAIFTAARGRTSLIITHRLSQIRWADLILVFRQGKLVASGSHEQLLQTSEAYRRIFSE